MIFFYFDENILFTSYFASCSVFCFFFSWFDSQFSIFVIYGCALSVLSFFFGFGFMIQYFKVIDIFLGGGGGLFTYMVFNIS